MVMTAKVVRVTPKMAAAWLATGDNVRSVRTKHRDRLLAAMRSGLWTENGDSIKFRSDGVMIDGQHRMAALARQDNRYGFVVVNGLKAIATDSIDADEQPKSLPDRLGEGPKAVAAYRAIKAYFGQERPTTAGKMTADACRKYINEYGHSVQRVLSLPNQTKSPCGGAFTAAIALALHHNPVIDIEMVAMFVDTARTMTTYGDATRDQVALKLARYMAIGHCGVRGTNTYQDWGRATQYMLRKYLAGEPCRNMRIPQHLIWTDVLASEG